MKLTPVQTRIVGCLVEKELATPDNYPLTMNALLAACNQTSNRNPVTRLDESTVGNALENLRAMKVVRIVYSRSNRADKFRHVLHEELALAPPELAVLAVLMLRGPQTASELRARTERLHPFVDQAALDDVLRRLSGRQEALVTRLDRQPGQKEARWCHLLGADLPPPAVEGAEAGGAAGRPPGRGDRVGALEEAVSELRAEVEILRTAHQALAARLGVADETGDA